MESVTPSVSLVETFLDKRALPPNHEQVMKKDEKESKIRPMKPWSCADRYGLVGKW